MNADERASCDGTPPDRWFPTFKGVAAVQQMNEYVVPLRRICSNCPVRAACRRMALEAEGTLSPGARYGIFGGWTPRQRARIAELSGLLVERDPDVQGDLFDLEAS